MTLLNNTVALLRLRRSVKVLLAKYQFCVTVYIKTLNFSPKVKSRIGPSEALSRRIRDIPPIIVYQPVFALPRWAWHCHWQLAMPIKQVASSPSVSASRLNV